MSKVRFRHFYNTEVSWGLHSERPGVKRKKAMLRRGRLVATIATQENEDGTISVAVSKVHPDDCGRASKFEGRSIASERLSMFQYMHNDYPSISATYDLPETSVKKLAQEGLVFTATKDELIEFIRNDPFSEVEKK